MRFPARYAYLIFLLAGLAVFARLYQPKMSRPVAAEALQQPLQQNDSRDAEDFTGVDCGDRINKAYLSLPEHGGVIRIHHSCSFSTAIRFDVQEKYATMIGSGTSATELTYTGDATALTIDSGSGPNSKANRHENGFGLRDLALFGPSRRGRTTGILLGGKYGAEGVLLENIQVSDFGVNIRLVNWAFHVKLSNVLSRAGGRLLDIPAGKDGQGENVLAEHSVFSDATTGGSPLRHDKAVVIEAESGDTYFTNCAFDNAQVFVDGDQTKTNIGTKVVFTASHFENPNGDIYPYIVTSKSPYNFVVFSGGDMLNNNTGKSPAEFIQHAGGSLAVQNVSFASRFESQPRAIRLLSPDAHVNVGFVRLSNVARSVE